MVLVKSVLMLWLDATHADIIISMTMSTAIHVQPKEVESTENHLIQRIMNVRMQLIVTSQ